jgi:hypothetical protein
VKVLNGLCKKKGRKKERETKEKEIWTCIYNIAMNIYKIQGEIIMNI